MSLFGRSRYRFLGRAASAALLAFAGLANAHDLWIEPATFRPAQGKPVPLDLRVGVDFEGESLPRFGQLFVRFDVTDEAGNSRPTLGRDGASPAGLAPPLADGLSIVTYESRPFPMDVPAEIFGKYLAEEGLDRIAELRKKRGQEAAVAKERFYRCAKALLLQGAGPGKGADRIRGLELELVPGANPYAFVGSGSLPLTLLFRGKPIAGVLVVAQNKAEPAKKVSARTDAKGRVTLKLPRGGFWLVKAVHMEEAPKDSGFEWESWWASLTFEMP